MPNISSVCYRLTLGLNAFALMFVILVVKEYIQFLPYPTFNLGSSRSSTENHDLQRVTSHNERRNVKEIHKLTPQRELARTSEDMFYQIRDKRIFMQKPFYDDRANESVFRFFGMHDKDILDTELLCRFKSQDYHVYESPLRRQALFPSWPNPKATIHAQMYDCNTHGQSVALDSVEVLIKGQGRGVTIPVQEVPTKPGAELAICLKCTYGLVNAAHLAEWIEFNLALGVGKIVIYDMAIQGEARRILQAYSRSSQVEVVPYYLPLTIHRMTKDYYKKTDQHNNLEQGFLVGLNHCAHKLRKVHKYVLVIDIDEVILPANANESLLQLVRRLTKLHPTYQGLMFKMAYHKLSFKQNSTKSLKSRLFMQSHLRRSPPTEIQPKSVMLSKNLIAINWHGPVLRRRKKDSFIWALNASHGYGHHFRDCSAWDDELLKQRYAVIDEVIPLYKTRIKEKVKKIISEANIVT